jgi:dihydrolipoamide dehydrogenase
MAQQIEVKVPDIGDFKDVAVIEIMVKAGETVAVDTGLIMVESDKASMEIPSSHGGLVKELKVKTGDKVSEGSTILVLEAVGAAAAPTPVTASPSSSPASPPTVPAPSAASYSGRADIECDMLVLGAGPGGYSAAFRAADLGMKTVLVERYETLGGVCLNVGCIPSKALLHTAAIMDEVGHLPDHGISFGPPKVDLGKLRGFKDGVIKKLTGGLAGMAKARKVDVVRGVGAFLDPHHLEVKVEGSTKTVKFAKAIIAAGSQATKLPFLPNDPRIVDSNACDRRRDHRSRNGDRLFQLGHAYRRR